MNKEKIFVFQIVLPSENIVLCLDEEDRTGIYFLKPQGQEVAK